MYQKTHKNKSELTNCLNHTRKTTAVDTNNGDNNRDKDYGYQRVMHTSADTRTLLCITMFVIFDMVGILLVVERAGHDACDATAAAHARVKDPKCADDEVVCE